MAAMADGLDKRMSKFDLPLSEPTILANERERCVELAGLNDQSSVKPSASVLAALEELEQPIPWHKTKEDLFRALEVTDEM